MSKKQRPGRPSKSLERLKSESILVRLEPAEKQAFKDASDVAGIDLSTWVRERLRKISRKELMEAGKPVAFLKLREPEDA